MRSITTTDIPAVPALPARAEALAVALERGDERAWAALLSHVRPVFGDPVAARVADILQAFSATGVRDGARIREMLAAAAPTAA